MKKGLQNTCLMYTLIFTGIIDCLLQLHNAEQLSNWCLHFISSNYTVFLQRKEFSLLKGANLEHVEEHRWPPLAYLTEVEEYEALMKAKGQKCAIM